MTRRLAFVAAHPDDDTYSVGGTVAREGSGLELTVVVATSGEAGQISEGSEATRERLAEVREREQEAAIRALGVSGGVRFLRFPDGGLERVERGELEERIVEVLRPARPDVVVTFGPEGITGHPDHIVVGQAATEAFHRLLAESGEGGGSFRRLLYVALPQSAVDRFWSVMRTSGVDFGQPDAPYMPRGVPDDTVRIRVDCSDVVERKIEAVKAHRSQLLEFAALPEDLQRALLAEECFVQAWPPAEPGGAPASGVFEGL